MEVRKLEGFVWGNDTSLSSRTLVVFHANPCSFTCFQAVIKSLPLVSENGFTLLEKQN